MSQLTVFKPWVPNWAIILILVFCMLHSMVLLGVYTSNITYAASYLDVEIEDLQFSLSVTYGTFLATILIESRLFKFFPTKKYFLSIYSLAALTFFLTAYTENYVVFICLRIVEGILMALPWIPLRQLLITRFKSKNAIIIGFSLNYATLLLASPFIMNIAVWLLENYEWSYMAIGSGVFQILCIGLVMLTFNENRFHKKIPLYQIDWASYILILLSILTGAFVLVYGEKKYWFESYQILYNTIISITSLGLFIFRQISSKRPVLDITIFQFSNLRTGFFLFIIFYISRTSLNICHTTMLNIWNWEPMRVAHIQYINVIGNAIGMILAIFMMIRVIPSRIIFIIGFGLMTLFHLWFTFLFIPDIALNNILLPYLIQGISVGILFVPLVLFTVSSVPSNYAPFAGTIGVTGRFLGNTLGFCILQNTQVFLQKTHYFKLIQQVSLTDSVTENRINSTNQLFENKGFTSEQAHLLSMKQINLVINKQVFLLSSMELFTYISYALIIILIFLIFNKHLKITFDIVKNSIWGN